MPNQSEPVTISMVLHMHARCANMYPDSIESALHDWNVLGLFYGFRLREWSQKFVDKKMPLVNVDGLPTAFTFGCIIFHRAQNTFCINHGTLS